MPYAMRSASLPPTGWRPGAPGCLRAWGVAPTWIWCRGRCRACMSWTLRGAMAGAIWTARRAHARGLRLDAVCPYCATGSTEDEEHILWACPRWDEARGAHLADLEASLPQAPVLGLRADWPLCLRLCGLLPEKDYPEEQRDAVQGVVEP